MIGWALLWVLSLPATLAGLDVAPTHPQAIGAALPLYGAEDDSGRMVDLRTLEGPILVNVWASWCPPCERELPVLAQVHQTWGPRGLTVVGISVDKLKVGPKRLIAKYALPFRVLYDHDNVAADALAVTLLPSTFLYDRGHRLVFFRPDVLTHDDPELKAALEKAVARP